MRSERWTPPKLGDRENIARASAACDTLLTFGIRDEGCSSL